MNARQERGYQIYKTREITPRQKGWIVPSQNSNKQYFVFRNFNCTCPDHKKRGCTCKHAFAVQYYIKETVRIPQGTVTRETKITYSQDWKNYNKSQQVEKEYFMKLLNDLCSGIEQRPYQFGRPTLPMHDMAFAVAFKVYSTFSLRRFMSDMRIAKEKGYVNKVPCFASVGHFMQNEELTPVLYEMIRVSSLPLRSVETKFAIDTSGFSISRFGRWFDYKYKRDTIQRLWIKAHIVSGVKTNIVTSVKVTAPNVGDCPEFAGLVRQTAENFKVEELSADMGYSSRKNYEVVAELGGQAYIPFKKKATGKSRGSLLWKKMFHYFQYNQEEFMAHYHKRSNAETVFYMIKTKFGDSLRSKTDTAVKNELLCKILCHNIVVLIHEMHELGIKAKFEQHNQPQPPHCHLNTSKRVI